MRINDEMKFLNMIKQRINNELCTSHLRLAKEWGKCWHIVVESISESLNKETEQKYKKKLDGKLKKTS